MMPGAPRRFLFAIRAGFMGLPRATRRLVAVCLGGYLLSFAFGPVLYFYFGLVPVLLVKRLWVWQPVTYMFMHGSLLHLSLNVFMLWMLGRLVEPAMGAKNFLTFFFATGLGAALFNVLLTPHSAVPIVGASGAIYGLLLAFAMLYPEETVYLYFLIPVRARYLAVVLGIVEFAASFASGYTGIANLAHLGGLLTGYLYLKFFPLAGNTRRHSNLFYSGWDHTGGPAPRGRQEQLNELLDKIRAGGLDSLSKEELRRLDEFSGRARR
ncbi:MAG: rhomboid family intramembrane serine protease [Elusimicrobiaceae bacterium]|nr:rhomboid family intramembrane serine protease [Elusimicrobiaceae bacterium]